MNKEIKKYSNSNQNFTYTGDIKIKLLEDDRVYSEEVYHNHGCAKLFNFFMDCLIGNYNVAKSSRPCRIVLYKQNDEELDNEGEFDINKITWRDEDRVSTKVYYDSTPEPLPTANGSSVTYHFRLPFLTLFSGEKVKKLGLYPAQITDPVIDLCAYFILPKGKEIEIPLDGGNFTIIVD
jgi:hypothetical protein